MQASSEVAKLKRSVETLRAVVHQDGPRAKNPTSASERRAIKSEIEWCIQELDELSTRLTG